MESDNIFIAKIFKLGDSKAIVIPIRNATYEGIEIGDTIKVMIKKL